MDYRNCLIINVSSKLFLFVLYIYFLNFTDKTELQSQDIIKNLKVCVCTLGKQENKYILEFVEHYKNYGVDKIYLYVNNDLNGEKFESIIGEYLENNFVEIINWRGVKGTSTYYGIMDSCYQQHYDEYDWIIFYELDEFLYLKNYHSIKPYLAKNKFKKCDSIQLNWVHMSDNNQLYYENKPLKQRFTERGKNVLKHKYNKLCYIKTIVKGHLKNISVTNNHFISDKIYACNGFGHESQHNGIASLNPDYEYYYILHYYGKSVQEFIEKINRGDLLKGNDIKVIKYAIEKFFYINKITLEKIKYIEKNLGPKFNLTKYINRIEK